MMRLLCLAVLGFLTGVIGNEDLCNEPIYRVCEPPDNITFPKTEEDINRICPLILVKLDCLKDYSDKCEYGDDYSEELGDTKGAMEDVCRKDTELHLGVVRNIGCFYEVFKKDTDYCDRYIRSKGAVVMKYIRNIETEREYDEEARVPELWMASDCLINSMEIACPVSKVSERCGHDAKNIATEVLIRLYTEHGPCSSSSEEKLAELLALMDLEFEEEVLLKRISRKE